MKPPAGLELKTYDSNVNDLCGFINKHVLHDFESKSFS